jgi:hypothetical protein
MTSPSRPTRATTIVLSLAGGLVAGAVIMFGSLTLVNGDFPLPPTTSSPTPSVSPRPLSGTAWAEATATALPVSVTPPGSRLVLGEPGQVELALGNGLSALMSINPGAPVAASEADVAVLRRVTPQLAGMSVYYLPVTVTKVAGSPLAGVLLDTVIFAVTADNVPLQRLTLVDWRACSNSPLPETIDEPGTTASLCFAAAAADSAKPAVGIQFSQPDGPFSAGLGTAVSWFPRT